ncbi:Predicted amino acid racemase [Austwickia chelonae]|uniref:Putative alanine racemase n=1 Tax=Austwickia chelonae NBRC 105200 TaxID=1184607 RepID=K6VPZ5_9MICO|nr:alanine/ornithine racemase family PLP-dependent enzyme [Austwickia chelonae]GAB77445.1 putative alanine racemase [Austwickia chelonae NBRC 105200]SEW10583.1 Predicted amino acid racemase [Austwickia chelonae]
MYLRTPRLEIHPDRITENARAVVGLCRAHGARVAGVAKVTCAHPAVVRALVDGGVDELADSRILNLMGLAGLGTGLPQMLLRIPSPSSVPDVVRCADITLNSSLSTLRILSEAAGQAGTSHGVVVMVDIGDLREGVWPDRAVELVTEAARLPHLDLLGLGANLACYGGVIPSVENMRGLISVRDACRAATGLELGLLSGGNSSSLPLLASGQMPKEINHFRIGESIVLGRNVLDRSPWPSTRQDTVRLVGEVVELERKPSVPIGDRGQNAFGECPEFPDRGTRLRAIVNIGRQDAAIDGLTPQDEGILIVGASSDHLILDVEDAVGDIRLGGPVGFWPSYAALLALSTSHYVQKVALRG